MGFREMPRSALGYENMAILFWEDKSHLTLEKSPEQRLLELEAKVKLLEKQKASLEKKLEFSDKKVIFLT